MSFFFLIFDWTLFFFFCDKSLTINQTFKKKRKIRNFLFSTLESFSYSNFFIFEMIIFCVLLPLAVTWIHFFFLISLVDSLVGSVCVRLSDKLHAVSVLLLLLGHLTYEASLFLSLSRVFWFISYFFFGDVGLVSLPHFWLTHLKKFNISSEASRRRKKKTPELL